MASTATTSAVPAPSTRGALVLGALGVVFGDIGTSPIDTVQTVFNPDDPHPVTATTDSVFGIISLVFWSVTIIVTVTYVVLVMRADNEGEGASWRSSPHPPAGGAGSRPACPRRRAAGVDEVMTVV